MIEGRISALSILKHLGFDTESEIKEAREDLNKLRSSPFSKKVLQGISEVQYE